MDLYSPQYFMKEALKLAVSAFEEGEVPVGAVVVANNRIIGKGYNQTEKLQDSTAHAEIIAITSAYQSLGAKYLMDCDLYVTLEPCAMCAGALNWSKVSNLFIGARDLKQGYMNYKNSKGEFILHKSTSVFTGILENECSTLVEQFFRNVRNK